jgi:membrane-associated phospholipid phosphatase
MEKLLSIEGSAPTEILPPAVVAVAPVSSVSLRDRAACGAALGMFWGFGYFGLAAGSPVRFDPTTGLDAAIPFIGWSVWVYVGGIVWISAPLVLVDERELFWQSAATYVAALSLGFLCFAAFQAGAPALRQQASPLGSDPLTAWALLTLHHIDAPVNLLPSLHVALVWMSSSAIWRQHPRWRIGCGLVAAVVTTSVCLSKQHTVLDVAAGLALAWLCSWLVAPGRRDGRTDVGRP